MSDTGDVYKQMGCSREVRNRMKYPLLSLRGEVYVHQQQIEREDKTLRFTQRQKYKKQRMRLRKQDIRKKNTGYGAV